MVTSKVLRLLPPLAALAWAAPAQAQGKPEWENPPAIPAESDLFRDRLSNPQGHFIQDGLHAFVAGREFYQAQGEPLHFLWPTHPWLRTLPDRRWLKDSSLVSWRLLVGNEVGDPLLQELASSKEWGNKTPITVGDLTWSPTGEWSVHGGLDQNDHFSYRTEADRIAIVGDQRRDEVAFIGGNVPPKSVAHIGGALYRHGGLLAAQANRGWWWTQSPVSGMPYAWKGFNADFYTSAGDDFDLALVDQNWESSAPGSFQASRWRRTELTLGFSGGGPGGWRWRLELGGQRRELYSDSAFFRFQEDTYPWRFRYRQAWSPEGVKAFRLENQGSFGVRDRMFSGQHVVEMAETLGKHTFTQGAKGYYRRPFASYREPREILNADSSLQATLYPALHARGVSGNTSYRFKHPAFQASLTGHYALEWGIPIFQGMVVDTLETLLIRAGTLAGSVHHYANFGGEAEAGGRLWNPAFWRLNAGLRGFDGEVADEVEYRPSPWWVGGGLGVRFPSDLRLEGILQYMGPKEVRGWGEDFETPSHLEANAALVQSLYSDRLELTASFLHAFGEDVREHPNGNPLVFRIVAGVKGSF